jgi:hypothetical protein
LLAKQCLANIRKLALKLSGNCYNFLPTASYLSIKYYIYFFAGMTRPLPSYHQLFIHIDFIKGVTIMQLIVRRSRLLAALIISLLLSVQPNLLVQPLLAGPNDGSIIFANIVDGVNNDRTEFTILYALGVPISGGCNYIGAPAMVKIANRQNVPVNGLQPGPYCLSQDPGASHLWTLVQCFTVGQNAYVPIVDSMIQLQAGMRVRCTFTNQPL